MQRLRCDGSPEAMDRILQEECRLKASKKLPATLLCTDFRFPTRLSAEQCTSDSIARLHAAMIEPGSKVVDLTAGLGIDCFHIAAKVHSVTAIDMNPMVAEALPHNAAALGLTNIEAHCADCADWLRSNTHRHFDVAFIDPARRDDAGRRVYSLADCSPDVVELMPLIRAVADRLIVKASPMLDITALLRDQGLRPESVSIIGTTDECKELVLDFRFNREPELPPLITAITDGHGEYSYRWQQPAEPREQDAYTPEPGMLVGFPWPAIVKAGACHYLPYTPLHPSVAVFAVDESRATDFSGQVYQVTRVEPFSSAMLKQLKRDGGTDASVTVRNFPITADALRQRISARENSACRLLGTPAGPSATRLLLWLTPLTPGN